MSRHPIVKRAQRSDKVYITVELPDAKDVKLKLEPEGKFNFAATQDGVPCEVEIELLDMVNVEKLNMGGGEYDMDEFDDEEEGTEIKEAKEEKEVEAEAEPNTRAAEEAMD